MQGFNLAKERIIDWYVIILIITTFTIPLSRKLVVYPLSFAFLLSFFIPGFVSFFKQLVQNRVTILFWIFFIIQLLGYFVTQNKNRFGFEIETKLSFLIVPFIFRNDVLNSFYFEKIKNGFIQGSISAVIINLLNSCYRYYYSGEIESFFYGNFSFNVHTSYFSAYLILSIGFILFSKKMRLLPKWWLALALLTLGVFLCMSRAGLLALTIVIIMFLTSEAKGQQNRKPIWLVAGGFLIISVLLIFAGNYRERIKQAFQLQKTQNQSIEAATGFERLSVWKTSLEIIAQNFWFGTGEADVRADLSMKYREKGLAFAEKYQLNCHNQFLQTFLANGVFGFGVLMLLIVLLLGAYLKTKNFALATFIVLILTGFMFESMLETQAGIVFFCFFYCFLTIAYTTLHKANGA